MDGEDLTQAAMDFPDPFRLMVRDEAGSTNDELSILGKSGAPEGLVLLAKNQTCGRGRRGAAWFSPSGESLAFSILLRPSAPVAVWPRLALIAGLAVTEALEVFSFHPQIKWPNDIWLDRRKVAGILVEAGPGFAVVGIGLNVNSQSFPPELAEIATSMQLVSGMAHSPGGVLREIITRFAFRKAQLEQNFGEIVEAVRERCGLTGETVSLESPMGILSGQVVGLSPNGELLLQTSERLERLIQADRIRVTTH